MLPRLNDRIYVQLVALLILTTIGELSAQNSEVPQWFLRPPTHKKYIYGTGVAPIAYDSIISIQNATRLSVLGIAKSIRVRIRGSIADRKTGSGSESAFFIDEIYSDDVVEKISTNSFVLDQSVSGNNVFVLSCIKKDLSRTENSFIQSLFLKIKNTKPMDAPTWVNTPPKKNGFIYGVSNSEPYYDVDESWSYSEKMARYRIATTIKEDTKSMVRHYEDGSNNFIEVLMESSVDQILENAIVKERWYDKNNHHYCTLVEYQLRN